MLARILMKTTGSLRPILVNTSTIIQPSRNMGFTTAVVAGAGSVAALLSARWFYRTWQTMQRTARLTGTSPFTYYYRGGFDGKMSRREAAMILGVREFARPEQIKAAHRRIMIVNHPDRGGSPYLATKINEAKAILDKDS